MNLHFSSKISSKLISERAALRRASTRGRRRGIAAFWLAGGITVFLGISAIVVDEGYWLVKKADMQKAADAAAMAGASKFALSQSSGSAQAIIDADTEAKTYTDINGFKDGVSSITVTTNTDLTDNHFKVTIAQPQSTFFGAIFGQQSVPVAATAVAGFTFSTPGHFSITGRDYGVNDGPINIGMYGPDQISERGDRYSAKYKNHDSAGNPTGFYENPDYRSTGYDFAVTVPSTFGTTAILQIYDPDSYNSGADSTAANKVWDEGGKDIYDEDMTGNVFRNGTDRETFTKYTLYSDNGTPDDTSDDVQIQTTTIGADASKDKQWDNTFSFNPQTYQTANPNVQFRLNATTVSGSNENGFNLRVARPGDTDATFQNGGNGSDVSAVGNLPVNFGVTGQGDVILGYVPTGATKVIVNHFDSDVGVTAGDFIDYTYVNGSTPSPVMQGSPLLGGAANDRLETDTLTLPSDYAGGTWHAGYRAGASDNTTWDLSYEGAAVGTPGSIRLVQ